MVFDIDHFLLPLIEHLYIFNYWILDITKNLIYSWILSNCIFIKNLKCTMLYSTWKFNLQLNLIFYCFFQNIPIICKIFIFYPKKVFQKNPCLLKHCIDWFSDDSARIIQNFSVINFNYYACYKKKIFMQLFLNQQ